MSILQATCWSFRTLSAIAPFWGTRGPPITCRKSKVDLASNSYDSIMHDKPSYTKCARLGSGYNGKVLRSWSCARSRNQNGGVDPCDKEGSYLCTRVSPLTGRGWLLLNHHCVLVPSSQGKLRSRRRFGRLCATLHNSIVRRHAKRSIGRLNTRKIAHRLMHPRRGTRFGWWTTECLPSEMQTSRQHLWRGRRPYGATSQPTTASIYR